MEFEYFVFTINLMHFQNQPYINVMSELTEKAITAYTDQWAQLSHEYL